MEEIAGDLKGIHKQIERLHQDLRMEQQRRRYTWRDRFGWWRERRQAQVQQRIGALRASVSAVIRRTPDR